MVKVMLQSNVLAVRLKMDFLEEECPTCEPPRAVWWCCTQHHRAPQEQNKSWVGFPHFELPLTTLLWGVKVPLAASLTAGSDTAYGNVLTSLYLGDTSLSSSFSFSR